jgi:predicted RNase H-like HicB family nuclease
MKLQKSIIAVIRNGEQSGYVAECIEIPVVTQGSTLDEVAVNLKEAVELFFEGETPAEFGFDKNPNLIVTLELEPDYA